MNMSEGQFIEHNHETEHLKETSSMQVELAMRKFGNDFTEERFSEEWIAKYSAAFREILHEELDANDNFWEDFKDKSFREELLKRIEQKLYENDEELVKETA